MACSLWSSRTGEGWRARSINATVNGLLPIPRPLGRGPLVIFETIMYLCPNTSGGCSYGYSEPGVPMPMTYGFFTTWSHYYNLTTVYVQILNTFA